MLEKSLRHNGAFSVNLKHLCTFFAGCLVFHLCNDEVSLLRGAELLDWHCPWEMICSSWIRNHVTMKERIIIVSRMHYFDFGKQHWIVWNSSFLFGQGWKWASLWWGFPCDWNRSRIHVPYQNKTNLDNLNRCLLPHDKRFFIWEKYLQLKMWVIDHILWKWKQKICRKTFCEE